MDKKKAGNTVFIVSLVIVAVMAIWSVVFNDSFTVVSNAAFKMSAGHVGPPASFLLSTIANGTLLNVSIKAFLLPGFA